VDKGGFEDLAGGEGGGGVSVGAGGGLHVFDKRGFRGFMKVVRSSFRAECVLVGLIPYCGAC